MKPSLLRWALPMVLAGSSAWASATYPAVVASELKIAFVPQQCALCHQNGVIEKRAVSTPFALSLKGRGLVLENEATLRTGLARLETDMVDSDGDGCTDIAELKAKEDPNVFSCGKDGGGGVLPAPRYGCGANVVPGAMAALAALLLTRLFRRRAPGS